MIQCNYKININIMEHSPNYTRTKEVQPKDRAILESIDECLEGYDRYLDESTPAIRGLARAASLDVERRGNARRQSRISTEA